MSILLGIAIIGAVCSLLWIVYLLWTLYKARRAVKRINRRLKSK